MGRGLAVVRGSSSTSLNEGSLGTRRNGAGGSCGAGAGGGGCGCGAGAAGGSAVIPPVSASRPEYCGGAATGRSTLRRGGGVGCGAAIGLLFRAGCERCDRWISTG